MDSAEVKDLFPGELRDLKEGILHWKPVTKPLKEIKRRVSTSLTCFEDRHGADRV